MYFGFQRERPFSLSLFITFLGHYRTSNGGCAHRPGKDDRKRQRAGVIQHLQIRLPPSAPFVGITVADGA